MNGDEELGGGEGTGMKETKEERRSRPGMREAAARQNKTEKGPAQLWMSGLRYLDTLMQYASNRKYRSSYSARCALGGAATRTPHPQRAGPAHLRGHLFF